jgi:hypothetical protein
MRVATYSTAALMLFALIAGGTEIGLNGFKFFVFREGGIGQTGGNTTDPQFQQAEKQAAHHAAAAPKGRHHKKTAAGASQ